MAQFTFTSTRDAQIIVSYDIERICGTPDTYFAKVSCAVEGSIVTAQSRIRAILINQYSAQGNGDATYHNTWTFKLYPTRDGASFGRLTELIDVLHHWRDHSITSVPLIAVEIDGVWQQDGRYGSRAFGFDWQIS